MQNFARIIEVFVIGFFIAVALSIIYVSAGRFGGRSGGQQSADILNAASGGLSGIANSLEGR